MSLVAHVVSVCSNVSPVVLLTWVEERELLGNDPLLSFAFGQVDLHTTTVFRCHFDYSTIYRVDLTDTISHRHSLTLLAWTLRGLDHHPPLLCRKTPA